MAHAARLENDTVSEVIVVPDGIGGDENDAAIEEYINGIGLPGHWIRTSYNAASNGFRGIFAAIGYKYDPITDKFIAPHAPQEMPANDTE